MQQASSNLIEQKNQVRQQPESRSNFAQDRVESTGSWVGSIESTSMGHAGRGKSDQYDPLLSATDGSSLMPVDSNYCDIGTIELVQDCERIAVSQSETIASDKRSSQYNDDKHNRIYDSRNQSDSETSLSIEEDECSQFYNPELDFRLESPSKRRRRQPVFGPNQGWVLSKVSGLINWLRPQKTRAYLESSSDSISLVSSQPFISSLEDKDLPARSSKYSVKNLTKRKVRDAISEERSFRGNYSYNRTHLSMAVIRKLFQFLFQRSTLALFGAFLIHVTLGTVYTLSNVNSYLTSYLRKHGFPNSTYAWSVWINSTYVIGQGISMILGGYLEKRFSARLACSLGCAIHSLSTIGTSKSIAYGPMAVLFTYGFLPGLGCGLAYMTPLSNGFGWFPNRKGLVAGVILAGFGLGTFAFNMAQTAYVNPDNLSPPEDANGYFTQESVLEKVPSLFVFIGSIYAMMQLVGCSLLFSPPLSNGVNKPIVDRMNLLEPDITLRQAIRTREFLVLFVVYGVTTQGVLFVNSMLKEYGQLFIGNDMYLAWTGSMASIANSAGRLSWGMAVDRYSFTRCFSAITTIFGITLFIMPFEFVLSSRLLYLIGTLCLFGSFSGWMSTYPVHLSRVFGRANSGMIYGVIYTSQVRYRHYKL